MEKKLTQHENSNCIKVVLFGPESTGKSVLSKKLADYYNTVFVPEFSRKYAEAKALLNQPLTKYDVLPIAVGQIKAENQQLKNANKLLICDTDLLETKVYSEYYYDGFCPESLVKCAKKNTYDLYLLTYIDTKWEADGIRDRPENRQKMFDRFEDALKSNNKPYVILEGNLDQKLQTCIFHIDKLLKTDT